MSSTRDVSENKTLELLKTSGVFVVTLLGLLLYTSLSVPAIIFYRRLGVSPTEIGLTYTNLLSGSTAEVIVIIIVLTYIFLIIAYILMSVPIIVRFIVARVRRRRLLAKRQPWELSDDEFDMYSNRSREIYERIMPAYEELFKQQGHSLDDLDANRRRFRDLSRLGVLNEEQSLEWNNLRTLPPFKGNPKTDIMFVIFSFKRWIRRYGRYLVAIFIVITVLVLSNIASRQARQVAQGNYTGSTGLFDYSASPVRISPSSATVANSVKPFKNMKLFLLGENSQYFILYNSKDHSTIRVPVADVIVVGMKS